MNVVPMHWDPRDGCAGGRSEPEAGRYKNTQGRVFSMDVVHLVAGLAILLVGGDLTLRGTVGLAKLLGVSAAVIGLTVVGFGTSAPELVVTVQAALKGQSGLAIGNVVGSNISNLLLVLGVSALICPLTCTTGAARRDAGVMAGASALLVGLGLYGRIVWWQGIVMVTILASYLGVTCIHDHRDRKSRKLHEQEAEELEVTPTSVRGIAVFTIAGLAGLILGADLMVAGAIGIATDFDVPETVIGLTIVALGTSLPELAATAVAAYRKQGDVAIANVIGSCIFNILSILGITSMVSTLYIEPDIRNVDFWVALGASVVVTVLLLRNRTIRRIGGACLLAGYIAYILGLGGRIGLI